MSNILETNVLIIGKSGVGKSSLLNYIFGEELMKTGTGRPVTEKGIFTEKLRVSEGFIINVSDTWGLEANKASEWEKLIMDEVKKHDCEKISAWFHTMFFCISAKSARVEEFEKGIIKSLIDAGNKVIVVLTHSDVNNVDVAIEKMSEELNGIGVTKNNIIKVCSIGKKLLGGRKTEPFGREEILYNIKNNLWETICNKLPKILDKIIDDSVNSWYNQCFEYIKNEIKWYNCQSNKKLDVISSYVKSALENEMIDLKNKSNQKYSEAYNYYFDLIQKYQLISTNKFEEINFEYNFDFRIEMIDRLAENTAEFLVSIIPFGIFYSRSQLVDIRKNNIKAKLDETREEIAKDLKKKNREQIEEMKKYSI